MSASPPPLFDLLDPRVQARSIASRFARTSSASVTLLVRFRDCDCCFTPTVIGAYASPSAGMHALDHAVAREDGLLDPLDAFLVSRFMFSWQDEDQELFRDESGYGLLEDANGQPPAHLLRLLGVPRAPLSPSTSGNAASSPSSSTNALLCAFERFAVDVRSFVRGDPAARDLFSFDGDEQGHRWNDTLSASWDVDAPSASTNRRRWIEDSVPQGCESLTRTTDNCNQHFPPSHEDSDITFRLVRLPPIALPGCFTEANGTSPIDFATMMRVSCRPNDLDSILAGKIASFIEPELFVIAQSSTSACCGGSDRKVLGVFHTAQEARVKLRAHYALGGGDSHRHYRRFFPRVDRSAAVAAAAEAAAEVSDDGSGADERE